MRSPGLPILIIATVLAIGVWLVHTLYLDVPIRMEVMGKIIETPLTVALLLAVVFALLLGLAWKALSLVLFFPGHLKRWRRGRVERKRAQILADGIKALALGDQAGQHKNFAAAAEAGIEPALTYYLAAAAADVRRKDSLLRRAASAEGDPMVRAMADARAKLAAGRPAAAAETLRLAGAGSSDVTAPLMMLMESCEQAGDVRGALDAAQRLLRRQPSQAALRAKAGALARRLLADAGNPEEVRTLIGTVSRGKSPSSVAVAAASRLAAVNDGQGASEVLAQAFRQDADAALLEAIADHGSKKLVAEALELGEKMQAEHPDDADLLRAVGHLAMRSELWGQARKALERAVELHPHRQNFHSLAELAEKEGKSSEEINRLYRRAADSEDG